MYARVTNFKVDPSRLPELSAKIKEMGPRAKALPGMVDAYAAWRAMGKASSWRSTRARRTPIAPSPASRPCGAIWRAC
jgi:hypothetical protein